MVYFSLLLTSFLAATLLPLSSEALLVALIYQGYLPWVLFLVAVVGNTSGSCVNWYLGKYCLQWQDKNWFPVKPEKLQFAQGYFQRYGLFSLLFAWVPVIGDPLTLFAGVMRVRFWTFLVLVAMGKMLRYAIILFFAMKAIQ